MRDIFSYENETNRSLLLETGFVQPPQCLEIGDKESVISAIKQYHCLVKVKAEIDQFCAGLDQLDIVKCIREHKEEMRAFLCAARWTVS